MLNYRSVRLPEFRDARIVVIGGVAYINLSADADARIIRFLRIDGGGETVGGNGRL